MWPVLTTFLLFAVRVKHAHSRTRGRSAAKTTTISDKAAGKNSLRFPRHKRLAAGRYMGNVWDPRRRSSCRWDTTPTFRTPHETEWWALRRNQGSWINESCRHWWSPHSKRWPPMSAWFVSSSKQHPLRLSPLHTAKIKFVTQRGCAEMFSRKAEHGIRNKGVQKRGENRKTKHERWCNTHYVIQFLTNISNPYMVAKLPLTKVSKGRQYTPFSNNIK